MKKLILTVVSCVAFLGIANAQPSPPPLQFTASNGSKLTLNIAPVLPTNGAFSVFGTYLDKVYAPSCQKKALPFTGIAQSPGFPAPPTSLTFEVKYCDGATANIVGTFTPNQPQSVELAVNYTISGSNKFISTGPSPFGPPPLK
jgi:hypothetical protein